MTGSISFDRAADVYDETRALPDDIARKLTDALARELAAAGADRVLEVGVGTGRIARPLAERGMRVCGVDIAPRMLAKLREQLTPRHAPPDLLLGDATALPFASGSFRAALVVHVLHLVSPLEQAIVELRRVLAPGGVLLHDVTNYDIGQNPWRQGLAQREAILTRLGFTPRKRPGPDEIALALRRAGGALRTVVYAEVEERTVPARLVERARDRIDSWTWEIPEAVFQPFLAEFERWCRSYFGDLEREYCQPIRYELHAWRFREDPSQSPS